MDADSDLPVGRRFNHRYAVEPLHRQLRHRPPHPPGARDRREREMTGVIEKAGGVVTGLDVTASGATKVRIDMTMLTHDPEHADAIIAVMREVEGVETDDANLALLEQSVHSVTERLSTEINELHDAGSRLHLLSQESETAISQIITKLQFQDRVCQILSIYRLI